MINTEIELIKKIPKLNSKSNIIKKTIVKIIQKLVHEEEINKFLLNNKNLKELDFIDEVLKYFNINLFYIDKQLNRIPKTGRLIIIANHPLGALDALSLIKIVGKVRKDIKIVANDFLSCFNNLNSLLIQINNFKQLQAKESIQKIYDSLENEEVVIIFPAGEVSRFVLTEGIRDGNWYGSFLKFAKKTNSPILPFYINARNTYLFYLISVFSKTISTLLLSDEMFKQNGKNICVYIQESVNIQNFSDSKKIIEMFKNNLYKNSIFLKSLVLKKFL
jgi:hypothetical protein